MTTKRKDVEMVMERDGHIVLNDGTEINDNSRVCRAGFTVIRPQVGGLQKEILSFDNLADAKKFAFSRR